MLFRSQETHEVEVEAGVKLNVSVAKRDDSAPWIVFVNSLMTNQKMWGEVLPRLSKTYNLITYDQRGHGLVRCAPWPSERHLTLQTLQSSTPPNPTTLTVLASDIATILSTLKIPTPIHAVIGVSQGGATTLAFGLNHASLTSRLIACDTQATSPAAN